MSWEFVAVLLLVFAGAWSLGFTVARVVRAQREVARRRAEGERERQRAIVRQHVADITDECNAQALAFRRRQADPHRRFDPKHEALMLHTMGRYPS